MMFKMTLQVTQAMMTHIFKRIKFLKADVVPMNKTLNDDLTEEIEWIDYWSEMISSAPCDFVWDRYYEEFSDKMILSKHNFFKLIKRHLNLKSKTVRIGKDSVKYCFYKPSQYKEKS